jgi:hypothetical protein
MPLAPMPTTLIPCTTLEVHPYGTGVIIEADANGALSNVNVVKAPNAVLRRRAQRFVQQHYGRVHPDTQVVDHPLKWGLTVETDSCGRVVQSTQ